MALTGHSDINSYAIDKVLPNHLVSMVLSLGFGDEYGAGIPTTNPQRVISHTDDFIKPPSR